MIPEETFVAQTIARPTLQVGFLTILQENNGFLGGYLVTNQWGRPLEFRLSTAVQPNRIHQILYGHTLPGYLCGELIGKTLVEKCTATVQFIVTDQADVLHLRPHVEAPVLCVGKGSDAMPSICLREQQGEKPAVFGHARFPNDRDAALGFLESTESGLDLAEPFARIREALAEARKMGVTARG